MTTPYLTKKAEEIAEHTEELKQLTARIKWQVADMKAKTEQLTDLRAQELIALNEYRNAYRELGLTSGTYNMKAKAARMLNSSEFKNPLA